MDRDEVVKVLKKALNDVQDCEANIKRGNADRALYDIGFAEDNIRKALKALKD
ncbi:hypothetical protein [Mesorhizobium sp. CN2-181]|uniref:hypothetical protein n=1 Tax=Mesorhizobium yinganensis TaxID=3157707 RepID=UPI0032B75A59